MRRVARWSSAIALAVLAVLATGLVTAGASTAPVAPAASFAAGEQRHECHGAPLLDTDHAAASPARGATADASFVVPGPTATCVRPVPVSPPGPGETDPAPLRDSGSTLADLQVFRI